MLIPQQVPSGGDPLVPRSRPSAASGQRSWASWPRVVLCLLLLSLPAHRTLATEEPDDARYRQALEEARAGHHETALATLQDLLTRHPEHRPYLYDYITVLGWAEHDTAALALLPRLDLARTPPYVLESLAKSARNAGRYQTAEGLYRRLLDKPGRRRDATLGLAMTLADLGRIPEARQALAALNSGAEEDPALLAARAYVAQRQGDYFAALRDYQAILQRHPRHRAARRGLILVAARLGAPHLATSLARAEKDLLNPQEMAAITADETAITIRWGRLPHDDPARRHEETDRSIATLEARLRRWAASGRGESPPALRDNFDLMVAYLDRQRPAEVIARYEKLPPTARPLPPYVLQTAAAAYLQLHRPERARDLLRQALRRQVDDFDMQLALVYALVESEAFPEALSLVDRLAATQPAWLGAGPAAYRKENPRRLQADSGAALVRAYADQLGAAQRRLERLSDQAPHNPRLRADRAYVYLWRGWPRRALEEFRIALDIAPGQLSARAGSSRALMARGDYRHGQALLRALRAAYPEAPETRDLARNWKIHNMRQLRLETGYSDSSGTAEGGENLDLDAWLYSRPQRYRYRGFVHSHLASAKFPEGSADYRRLGVGLEYRRADLELISELNRDLDDSINAGLSLHGRWQNDHWRLAAGYDSYSDDIPLRGRLNEDLDGWGLQLDLGYAFHESRRLDMGLRYLDFSDGNRRRSIQGDAFQRLINHPHYKLDGTLGIYTSRNDRDNAPYFNPRRDLSVDLALINEWLQYRRYERSLRHRLAVGLGRYDQRGFGGGATWLLRYELQWNPCDRLELILGLSRAHRIYDGEGEDINRIHLNLDWRF